MATPKRATREHSKKVAVHKPRREPSPETAHYQTLILDLQRDGSEVLEKDILGCKTAKRNLKRFMFILKGAENEFTSLQKKMQREMSHPWFLEEY